MFCKAKSAKKKMCGNFRQLSNKNVQIWDNFFPLLFPKDSESLKILDIWLWKVGTSKVNTQTDKQTDRQTDRQTDISTYRKHLPERRCFEKSVPAHFEWFKKKIGSLVYMPNYSGNKMLSFTHGLSRFLNYWPLQNRAFPSTLGKTLLKRCNLKTLPKKSFLLCAYFCEQTLELALNAFFINVEKKN